MVDLWQVAIGGEGPKMEKAPNTVQSENAAALAAVERVLREFRFENVSLFDHTPVLRIQLSDTQFERALQLRETLVERIKPLGYRFIALDLDEL